MNETGDCARKQEAADLNPARLKATKEQRTRTNWDEGRYYQRIGATQVRTIRGGADNEYTGERIKGQQKRRENNSPGWNMKNLERKSLVKRN